MKNNYKTIGISILTIIIIIYLGVLYFSGKGEKELVKNNTESIYVEEENEEVSKEMIVENKKKLVVEIKGQVNNPNIYYLEDGSIINDLINEAGGLTNKAAISNINRAELLTDHACIVIPSIDEEAGNEMISSSNSIKSDKININTATAEELDKLPGVGPAKAEDIISYRESNGRFKTIEELKNVKGIGESSFEKIKEKITI